MTLRASLSIARTPQRRGLGPITSRWRAAVVAALAAGLLVGASGGAALAGTAYSANGYFTVAGNQYVNKAIINTGSGIAIAITNTSFSAGGTPVGYAGARGRLFTSGGSLVCEGGNTYNSSHGGLAVGHSCNSWTHGTWYSYGVSLGWNGSSYNSFYTYQSPNQNS